MLEEIQGVKLNSFVRRLKTWRQASPHIGQQKLVLQGLCRALYATLHYTMTYCDVIMLQYTMLTHIHIYIYIYTHIHYSNIDMSLSLSIYIYIYIYIYEKGKLWCPDCWHIL